MYDTDNGAIIAMCDENLIDKVLEEGDILIDIKTYSSFYIGDKVTPEVAKRMISAAKKIYSTNVVGNESVKIALEMHIVERDSIKTVNKVKYAQSFQMNV